MGLVRVTRQTHSGHRTTAAGRKTSGVSQRHWSRDLRRSAYARTHSSLASPLSSHPSHPRLTQLTHRVIMHSEPRCRPARESRAASRECATSSIRRARSGFAGLDESRSEAKRCGVLFCRVLSQQQSVLSALAARALSCARATLRVSRDQRNARPEYLTCARRDRLHHPQSAKAPRVLVVVLSLPG